MPDGDAARKLNYGGIALMWRGGCIIRSAFLGEIKKAFDKKPGLVNLDYADIQTVMNEGGVAFVVGEEGVVANGRGAGPKDPPVPRRCVLPR